MFIKDSNTDNKEFRLIGDLFDFAFLRESLSQIIAKNNSYVGTLLFLNRGLNYSIQNKIIVNSKVPNINPKDLKNKGYDHPYISYYSLSIPVYLAYYITIALEKTLDAINEDIEYSYNDIKTPCKSFIFSFYEYLVERIGKEKTIELLSYNINLSELEENDFLREGNVNSLYEDIIGSEKQ